MNGIDPGWLWLSAGLLLAGAEIVAPGVFLIWIGVAAMLAGALTLASGVGLPVQLAMFAAFAIGAVLAARRWAHETDTNAPVLNEPAARLVGAIVVTTGPVDHAGGRVRHRDGTWPARSWRALDDGERARVVGMEGGQLLVERIEAVDSAA